MIIYIVITYIDFMVLTITVQSVFCCLSVMKVVVPCGDHKCSNSLIGSGMPIKRDISTDHEYSCIDEPTVPCIPMIASTMFF